MLKLEQIKKSYDGVEILKEMNLEIEDGEIVSILGPSGCGKTTLLNLILGITEADSGKIWFNGEDITNLAMEKRGFNIVFQDYALFPNLNGLDREEVRHAQSALRGTAAKSGTCQNIGHEAENPAPG